MIRGMRTSVDACVVTWNSSAWIRSCLEALVSQTRPPDDIVVVDNASSDATVEIVAEFGNRVRVIANRGNMGFSRAANQAFRETSGEFFATVNPDVLLAPRFFEECLEGLGREPRAGMAAGKLIREAGGTDGGLPTLDSAGLILGRDRRGEDRGQGLPDGPAYGEETRVFGPCGAAAVFRRAMLRRLAYPGGEVFDEEFFCYKEDLDLAWRAQRLGWFCLYLPEARGTHARRWRRGNRRTISRTVRIHSLKNRYLMLLKNASAAELMTDIGPLLWFEARALVYWVLFEPELWRAYPAALRHARSAWRKRRWFEARIRQAGGPVEPAPGPEKSAISSGEGRFLSRYDTGG